ncbi:unnamed protein product [Phaeothamnion confervicola]
MVTALAFYKVRAFSGSTDCTIQVWDVEERVRLLRLQGHEATVTSVSADETKIVSGSADKKVLVWHAQRGTLLRSLHGHSKSVTSLVSGPWGIVSGCASGEVRLWKAVAADENRGRGSGSNSGGGGGGGGGGFGGSSDAAVSALRCTQRFIGHPNAATTVRYGALEVASGHRDGTIIVWWTASGAAMRTVKVHDGPVRQLQFDATKVLSCGRDGVVAVTDLTTGEPLMSLRGHGGAVLALAFDTHKAISGSDDGTLRLWSFGAGGGKADKYHVLDKGDNLALVAKKYRATTQNLLLWNGIRDPRQVGPGSRLIVQKGDPTKPTEAEAAMLRREEKAKLRAQAVEGRRRGKVLKEKQSTASDAQHLAGIGFPEDDSTLAGRVGRGGRELAELHAQAEQLHQPWAMRQVS